MYHTVITGREREEQRSGCPVCCETLAQPWLSALALLVLVDRCTGTHSLFRSIYSVINMQGPNAPTKYIFISGHLFIIIIFKSFKN